MSAYPEDWQQPLDVAPDPAMLGTAPRPAAPDPGIVPVSAVESDVVDGSTSLEPPASSVAEPTGSVEPAGPARVLPVAVLEAIADGGATVTSDATDGGATISFSGFPMLRVDPARKPPAAWCEAGFGTALVGLFYIERLTRVLAANRNAELTLHRGLRAELDIQPVLRGLGRGGFRAVQGGGVRATEYRVSHPVLGEVVKLTVHRNSSHVSEVAWAVPRMARMLRTLVAIEAQARRA
ncbi:MAG: hypothetical protein U0869_26360 [Chloroflexota bacterium]